MDCGGVTKKEEEIKMPITFNREHDTMPSIPDGQGTFTYLDGAIYTGAWASNQPHGTGTWTEHADTNDGTANKLKSYTGDWVNGQPHGTGTRTNWDDSTYVGAWEDGKAKGAGRYEYASGDSYDGTWDDWVKVTGTYRWANGKFYQGAFSPGGLRPDGILHSLMVDSSGTAEMRHPDGQKYVGQFANNDKHGTGTWTDSTGQKYVGEWSAGKFHGQGKLTWTTVGEGDPGVAEGVFNEGALPTT